MNRTPLSPSELFQVLDREFFRHKPIGCLRCLTPPVVRRRESDPQCSDWFVGPIATCENGCRSVLNEIIGRLQAHYCLEVDGPACTLGVPEYRPVFGGQ